MKAPRRQKVIVWFPVLVCLLLAGTVWFGFRQTEVQTRNNQLFTALRGANPVGVRAALDQGADPNSREIDQALPVGPFAAARQWFAQAMHPDQAVTALTVAAYAGNPQSIRLLLDRGALPTRSNGDGSTSLMAAASVPIPYFGDIRYTQAIARQQLMVMQMLLDKGADINAQSGYRRTALGDAVNELGNDGPINLTVVRFLLNHGAKPDAPSQMGGTLLLWVAKSDNNGIIPLVNLLLDHGANVNGVDTLGWTVLQRASQWINPALVETLLKHGANPNCQSSANDMTPLMEAARQGQAGTVRLLLARGADASAVSRGWGTALVIATQNNRANIVRLLLDSGANPNYHNRLEECEPALVVAASNNNAQIVRLLLSAGADANLEGQDDTPLTVSANGPLAASYKKRHNNLRDPGDLPGLLPAPSPGEIIVTQMLLAAGADANKTD